MEGFRFESSMFSNYRAIEDSAFLNPLEGVQCRTPSHGLPEPCRFALCSTTLVSSQTVSLCHTLHTDQIDTTSTEPL